MTIEKKLELLRVEWKLNPEKRSTVELQVKVLKLGQQATQEKALEEEVENALF